jgi:hypothetical protein
MLPDILRQLEAERDRLSAELNQLDRVLKILGRSSGNGRRGCVVGIGSSLLRHGGELQRLSVRSGQS